MTFAALMSAWRWRPIANCPGRFVLMSGPTDMTPRDLVGAAAGFEEFRVATARDVVVVARFDDGGIISYRRANGAYLHTLNTGEGFERKLAQLGIALAARS
jgi:hypothetical protein